MTSISKFDLNVYSEELSPVTSEREYDDVMSLMAEQDDGFKAYDQWSADNEASAWRDSKTFNTPHGEILVKKYCDHRDCPHTSCSKSIRIGGIEI